MSKLVTPAILALAICLGLGHQPAGAGEVVAPEGARVFIVSPADGARVTSPVAVVFGIEGMEVAPAGTEKDNTGHHHLLIDVDPSEIDYTSPLPADDRYKHFGGGQTEASVELAPGQYTLRLLFADLNHIPHEPPVMSEPITITVE